MKISSQWIADQIDAQLSPEQVAAALGGAGVEIEGIEPAPQLDAKLVVGEITALRPHPNAERLNLCTVLYGPKQPVEVVCGAPNVAVGLRVVYARPGTVLPDGTKIETAKLRGIESAGMLCSAQELGLGDDHSGLLDLGPEAKVGEPASSVIGHDDVIDVTTAANRWDVLSMRGLAVEAAAQLSVKLQPGDPKPWKPGTETSPQVTVKAKAAVRRFTLLRLSVEPGGASPQWLQRRLRASGVRPISPIVDITNYVMLEQGQPLHAFDADKLRGGVTVRLANQGETLVTLDGQHRQLDPADLVIADSNGAVALGGVMGGANSEVDGSTTSVLLEAASFDGATIRLAAQRHGLRSDASARFERQLPVGSVDPAVQRAVELLIKLCGAKVETKWTDHVIFAAKNTTVTLEADWLSRFLGLPVTATEAVKLLAKLGIKSVTSGGKLTVSVPWRRPDIATREDIAEEVIKLLGYDQLPTTLPAFRPDVAQIDHQQSQLVAIKQALVAFGLFEVGTYSFISEDQAKQIGAKSGQLLEIANPLSQEQRYLRSELLPSLLAAAARNQRYADNFGLFELSRVYHPVKPGVLPEERLRIGIITYHKGVLNSQAYSSVKAAWQRLARQLRVAAPLSVPKQPDAQRWLAGRNLELSVDSGLVGQIGQLHPELIKAAGGNGSVGYAEFDVELLLTAAGQAQIQARRKFPSITRDITVTLSREVYWNRIFDVINTSKITHLQQLNFHGDYYGDQVDQSTKRITLRLRIGSDDATLTGGQADVVVDKVSTILQQKLGAKSA